jgi:hypothetical protein
MDRINLAQQPLWQWWAFVNTVMTLLSSDRSGICWLAQRLFDSQALCSIERIQDLFCSSLKYDARTHALATFLKATPKTPLQKRIMTGYRTGTTQPHHLHLLGLFPLSQHATHAFRKPYIRIFFTSSHKKGNFPKCCVVLCYNNGKSPNKY